MAGGKGKEIKAGGAFVTITTDDTALVRGLARAGARLQAWGKAVTGLGLKMAAAGAAAAAPFALAVKSFADQGAALLDMSQRTGIAVESLSLLKFAAEQSGTDIGTLEAGLKKMSRGIVDASQGGKAILPTLKALGVTWQELAAMTPEEQFRTLSERILALPDDTQRAAAAMEMFGRSGADLIPTMMDLNRQVERGRQLGLAWTKEDAEAAEAFGDQLGEVKAAVMKGMAAIGNALVPTLKVLVENLVNGTVAVTNWVRENKGVVVAVAAGVVAFTALGGALVVLGYAISTVGVAFGVLAAVIKIVIGLFAFLLSPVGLIVVALGALAAAILYATGAGGKALEALGAAFESLKGTATTAFEGIKAALAVGDFAAAWNIAVAALKVIWLQFVDFITGIWRETWDGAVSFFEQSIAGLQILWHAFGAFLVSTLANVGSTLIRLFAQIGEALTIPLDLAIEQMTRFLSVAARLKVPGAADLAEAMAEFRVAGGAAGAFRKGIEIADQALQNAGANAQALAEQRIAQLIEEQQAVEAVREAQRLAAAEGRQADVEAAQAELERLRAEAVEKIPGPFGEGIVAGAMGAAQGLAQKVGEGLEKAKAAVGGGFASAGAMQAILAGDKEDMKIRKEVEKHTPLLKGILDAARGAAAGAAFA